MTYAKELACNLFNTYQDWYDNYLEVTGHEPDEKLKFGAMTYYSIGDDNDTKGYIDGYQQGYKDAWRDALDYFKKGLAEIQKKYGGEK